MPERISVNWSDWHLECTYKAEIEEQVSGGRVSVGKKIPELLETEVGKRLEKVKIRNILWYLVVAPPPGCPQGRERLCPPAGPPSGSLRPSCSPLNWSSLLRNRNLQSHFDGRRCAVVEPEWVRMWGRAQSKEVVMENDWLARYPVFCHVDMFPGLLSQNHVIVLPGESRLSMMSSLLAAFPSQNIAWKTIHMRFTPVSCNVEKFYNLIFVYYDY